MSQKKIQYKFILNELETEIFNLSLDTDTVSIHKEETGIPPSWTSLEYYQCPNCPLSKEESSCCPLAYQISDVVERFEKVLSYTEIALEIRIDDMMIRQETTAQDGISFLLGLYIATSKCPHTRFLEPMARFHEPFADSDESIYRSLSMFALAQYFMKGEGLIEDFDPNMISKYYENISIVNGAIADRIRAAELTKNGDSSINAITLLDMLAMTMPMVIEDMLADVENLFEAYVR